MVSGTDVMLAVFDHISVQVKTFLSVLLVVCYHFPAVFMCYFQINVPHIVKINKN